jgi:hypothetical protein
MHAHVSVAVCWSSCTSEHSQVLETNLILLTDWLNRWMACLPDDGICNDLLWTIGSDTEITKSFSPTASFKITLLGGVCSYHAIRYAIFRTKRFIPFNTRIRHSDFQDSPRSRTINTAMSPVGYKKKHKRNHPLLTWFISLDFRCFTIPSATLFVKDATTLRGTSVWQYVAGHNHIWHFTGRKTGFGVN